MDASKSDLSVIDLESEIAKTAKLIQKLDYAEQSIDRERNINLEACHKISKEIEENEDERLRRWIDRLRVHIVSLKQFPNEPPYYYSRVYTTSSLRAKTEVEQAEEAIRKLNLQVQHSNKNLATERKIGRELQQFQSKLQEQLDHCADDRMQETLTNRYHTKNRRCYKYDEECFRYVLVKPSHLLAENTKGLIKMWADKIQDASSRILEDSKTSIPTAKTRDKLRKLERLGMQFYWQVGVGREEFESLWGSMKDTKKTIAEIKSSLIKVRNRHQRGCLRMERLKEKRVELEKSNSELWEQSRIIRQEKFMLEQKLKQMYQLQVT